MTGKIMPLSFVCSRVDLTWPDLLWGCEQQRIDYSNAADMAVDKLAQGVDDPDVLEIAVIGKSDIYEVKKLVQKLAERYPERDESEIKQKWLYLTLFWLYENRADFNDPLAEVENIYTDFDYPEDIKDFVRYMPISDGYDPEQHSIEDNRARLFDNWKRYVSRADHKFRGK